jgi:hypothetical protein
MPDARFVVALLVLRGVVVRVLTEVAVLARTLDPLGDLRAALAAAELELLCETVTRFAREMHLVHRTRVPGGGASARK